MSKFNYLKLCYGSTGLYAASTDAEVLDWIIAEAKSCVSLAKVEPLEARASGEVCAYKIYNLDNCDREIGNQILRKLCLQGWEPFSVSNFSSETGTVTAEHAMLFSRNEVIHFRFKFD